jgi:hypothetical protein
VDPVGGVANSDSEAEAASPEFNDLDDLFAEVLKN